MLNKLKEIFVPIIILIAIVGMLFLTKLLAFDAKLFLNFVICSLGVGFGQLVFLLGADNSVIQIGKHSGSGLMKTKKLWLILLFGAIFGLLTTLAEPDLQLLSKFLSAISAQIPNLLFITIVGFGVSFMTAVAYFRILKGIKLRYLLVAIYTIIFVLVIFADKQFIALAFDSSGITTGPVTVPFLLALTIGICFARSSNNKEDNFGVVGLASTGPIIAVLILSFFYPAEPTAFTFANESFIAALVDNTVSVLIAFVPIIVIFVLLQIFMFRFPKKQFWKIIINFAICIVGLIAFLTSAVYGFSPMATYIGTTIDNKFVLMVLAIAFGLILIFTEPAIRILLDQIKDITNGAIKSKSIIIALAIAVSLSLALTLVKIFFDLDVLDVLYFIAPAMAVALVLSFITPPLFCSIAFDSGGVVSGTMLVAFVLPFFIGISNNFNGTSFDAFGTVALTSILPILAIEILGVIYKYKLAKYKKNQENNTLTQEADLAAKAEKEQE